MTYMLNKCRRQRVPMSQMMTLTTQEIYEKWEYENRDTVRHTPQDQKALDLGFGDAVKFKGSTLTWDENVIGTGTSDNHRIFFIAAPHLKFCIHKNRNFAMTDFRRPVDQDAKVAHMLFMGQLISDNNKHHGVIEVDNI